MVYKGCIHYDGDEDVHKCCSPNQKKYIWNCPNECPDYRDCFGHGLDGKDGNGKEDEYEHP